MAINKRKDAAALFELIDKSTLKVPKNAGSLKIPSWWSSKSNPASEAGNRAGQERANERDTAEKNDFEKVQVTGGPTGEVLPEVPSQTRLFDPPPASVVAPAPGTSPSIRPPSMNVPMGATVKAPAVVIPVIADERMGEKTVVAEDVEENVERGTRVFAPQTYSPGRRTWSRPRPGSMARMPMWAIAAAGAALIIMICGIVLMFRGGKTPSTAAGSGSILRSTNGSPGTTGTDMGQGRGLIPRAGQQPPVNGADMPANKGAPESIGTLIYTGSTGTGHVYAPGSVVRKWELLYIVIASTPSRQLTERNAKWLADHGVDVSIETQYPNGTLFYTLVSVQGFASNTAAEPTRMRIVEIGRLLMKNAWNDPAVRRVVSKPAAAP